MKKGVLAGSLGRHAYRGCTLPPGRTVHRALACYEFLAPRGHSFTEELCNAAAAAQIFGVLPSPHPAIGPRASSPAWDPQVPLSCLALPSVATHCARWLWKWITVQRRL